MVEFQGAIAKWLRRQIRNLFLFEGAGSNPARVVQLDSVFFFLSFVKGTVSLVSQAVPIMQFKHYVGAAVELVL